MHEQEPPKLLPYLPSTSADGEDLGSNYDVCFGFSVPLYFSKFLGPVHTTPFLLVSVFVASKLSVHTTPFLYKNGEKNLRLCAFTLICLITKTQRKTSFFVLSHYSVFVKPIVAYWCVFKNLRFCAFTLIKCVFENLRFCGYPLLIAFSETSVFVAFLCGSV